MKMVGAFCCGLSLKVQLGKFYGSAQAKGDLPGQLAIQAFCPLPASMPAGSP